MINAELRSVRVIGMSHFVGYFFRMEKNQGQEDLNVCHITPFHAVFFLAMAALTAFKSV